MVNRLFTPRSVAPLEARIRDVVRGALDAVATDEPVDLVEALAAPVPLAVIAELLGIDGSDGEQLRRWSDATIESADGSSGDAGALMAELMGFLADHCLLYTSRAGPGRPGRVQPAGVTGLDPGGTGRVSG